MIALRRKIERGLANPWLRPFLIVLLAVMLAFLVLHAAHDGAGGEMGAVCLGIAIALSSIVLTVARAFVPLQLVSGLSDRAPPPQPVFQFAFRAGRLAIPLRR